MATDPIGSNAPTAPAGGQNSALRGLDLDEFLKLMITELQNQDPLNPLENAEILQQISQIREIEATSKLGETLDAVLLGQSVASASSLIGQSIRGLTAAGDPIEGVVDRVSIEAGKAFVHVADQKAPLSNLQEIRPAETEDAETDNTNQ